MTKRFGSAVLLCTILLLTGACSKESSKPSSQSEHNAHQANDEAGIASSIQITDSLGQPIAKANVLIGSAENKPFPDNIVTTDQAGRFLPPKEWTTPLSVTIWADQYVRTTYLHQLPVQASYSIRALPAEVKPELNGTTLGFDQSQLKKDGFVDIGIIIPALNRKDISNFQVASLLSPEVDTISVVLGQKAHLPSNVTLPEQTESMFGFSFKLKKPNYRMYFEQRSHYRIVSAHVRFPLKKAMDEMGKGLGVVNHFSFLEAGITDMNLTADKQTKDLNINQIQFSGSIQATAPSLPKNHSMLAVALVKDGEYLYPTDIKNLKSKENKSLSFISGSDGYLLSVVRPETTATTGAETDFMSLSLGSAHQSEALEFLPITKAPKLSKGNLILTPPNSLPTLTETATLATLTEVEVKKVGDSSYEIKQPQWDIYGNGWVAEMQLPEFNDKPTKTQKRWEVSFLAVPEDQKTNDLGPELFKSVTHLSRSAVDL